MRPLGSLPSPKANSPSASDGGTLSGASVRLSLSAMSANPEQSCGVATGHVAADARVKGKRGAEWRGIGIVRIAAERAAEARREADKLACDAWTKRMLAFKGPAQPSPTLGDALNAGYTYLEVRCLGCDTHQSAALDIVRQGPKVIDMERR